MLLDFSDRTRTGIFNMIWPLAREVVRLSLLKGNSSNTLLHSVQKKRWRIFEWQFFLHFHNVSLHFRPTKQDWLVLANQTAYSLLGWARNKWFLPIAFWTETKNNKKPTAPRIPRRSPIQVLTRLNVAWLQWSDENWYIQHDMAVGEGGGKIKPT